ncbi:ABC transporter permease [Roseivirga sp.]|uniref:ABC transporter permease n=1 Tax=Roseivirga sp. TaxID=1964215 RepID=UPI003B8E257A
MIKKKDHITPPKFAQKVLKCCLKNELLEEIEGDLEEKYQVVFDKHGAKRAKRNYWLQVAHYMRPFAVKKTRLKLPKTTAMHRHYLKISWRNLLRDKVFSTIKIGGFAIGIAACILISLYINHELSYDKHYEEGERIFRIANSYQSEEYSDLWANLHGPFKPVLEEYIPEIESVSRVVLWRWGNVGENHIRLPDSPNNIYESGFFYADPELLEILEIPMVYGSQKEALDMPNSIVISKSKAAKYFPNQNPVGEQIVLNDDTENAYTIGGVMEDFLTTSHLQGDFIMTLKGRKTGPGTSGWCCTNYNFYIKVVPNADKAALEQKLVDIRDTYVINELKEAGQTGTDDIQKHQTFYLQPVDKIYLNRENVADNMKHGTHDLIWIFGGVALTILLLAALNFINLSTAKSVKRAKEVGLRKVVGSHRSGLIVQHLTESSFYSILSVAIGACIAWAFLPTFNHVAAQSISIPWTSYWFIPTLFAAALLIGFLSGVYPAFYLSKFNPIQVLKGNVTKGVRASFFRNSMVVFQFTVTVVLIISALVSQKQFQHFMTRSLGFEKEQVINVLGLNGLNENERQVMKEEMLRIPTIEYATLGDYIPVEGGRRTNFGFDLLKDKGLNQGFEAARWAIDEDYLATMSMDLIEGRNFNKEMADENSIIINESMAQGFNLEDPIDVQVVDMFDGNYRIIGVVKDFYFESLTGTVRPLAMVLGDGREILSLKVDASNVEQTLSSIQNVWDTFKPNQPLRYSFMDQKFEQMYEGLTQAKTLLVIFSILSVTIACLGLFALSAYSVEQRIKEVSVRKVLGATAERIFKLLATDFIKLILIAIIIAIPVGYYLMDMLLGDMANRIDLSWSIFGFAALLAFTIALITVSFESIKAATINPATRLRSE